jgi:hypothetical protein
VKFSRPEPQEQKHKERARLYMGSKVTVLDKDEKRMRAWVHRYYSRCEGATGEFLRRKFIWLVRRYLRCMILA